MRPLSTRTAGFTDSVIRRMTRISNKYGAINLSRNGAKALVLCNPSNPCGKVFTREELQTITDIVIKYDGYVITDEVYEHIVYAYIAVSGVIILMI